MSEIKVRVWGLTANEIVYEAFHMTWDNALCGDAACKCTDSARWRATRAIEAVREFERNAGAAVIEALQKRIDGLEKDAAELAKLFTCICNEDAGGLRIPFDPECPQHGKKKGE